MDCCYTYLTIGVLASVTIYFGYEQITKRRLQKMLERWSNTPKDLVILHGFPRGRKMPNGSGFVLKLETYLKMAKIPYKYDSTDPVGPKGKTPWLSLNGQHVADSQLCIDFLSKKFDKNLNTAYSDEQIGIATAVRIMIEEHLFWGIRRWIFVLEGKNTLHEYIKVPYIVLKIFVLYYSRKIVKDTWAQGLSRHSEREIEDLINRDITSIANILGNKKFLLGNEPCEADACLFGFMAGFAWDNISNSPYGKFIKNNHPNLITYCDRMKEKYWQDWENCCDP